MLDKMTDNERNYAVFLLGYDILNDKLKTLAETDSDVIFDKLGTLAINFEYSPYYREDKNLYDALTEYCANCVKIEDGKIWISDF